MMVYLTILFSELKKYNMKYNFILSFVIVISFITKVNAQPGSLDESYGNKGRALVDGSVLDRHYSFRQSDKKLLIGGARSFSRINEDGSKDFEFGTDGSIDVFGKLTEFDGLYLQRENLSSIIQLKSAKIITMGQVTGFDDPRRHNIWLSCYTESGKIDSSFGTNGHAIFPIPNPKGYYTYFYTPVSGKALLELPNGSILVSGIRSTYDDQLSDEGDNGLNESYNAYQVAFKPDGSMDESFGENGVINLDEKQAKLNLNGAFLTDDNKILVVGGGKNTITESAVSLARYDTDGTPDISFGNMGIITSFFVESEPGSAAIWAAAMDNEKRVILGYQITQLSLKINRMLFVRLMPDGIIDRGFGNNGLLYVDVFTSRDELRISDMETDASGNIIVSGIYIKYSPEYEGTNGFLLRITPEGQVDPYFGKNGWAQADFTDIALGTDYAYINFNVHVTEENKLLSYITFGSDATGTKIGTCRYFNEGTLSVTKLKAGASVTNNEVLLQWQYTGENNITGFEIERSLGQFYERIGYVAAYPDEADYSFTDKTPLAGTNLYRIKSINTAGQSTYSETVAAVIKGTKIKIKPNPVTHTLTITGLSTSNHTLSIRDMDGRQLLTTQTNQSVYNWPVASLLPGTYYIIFVNEAGHSQQLKFIKL